MSNVSHVGNAQPDYSKVMGIYEGLKSKGLKAEADRVMKEISAKYTADHPAPPEEIQHGLEAIIKKHDAHHDADNAPHANAGRASWIDGIVKMGLAAASVYLIASGLPPVP